jgi:hypothetical protein
MMSTGARWTISAKAGLAVTTVPSKVLIAMPTAEVKKISRNLVSQIRNSTSASCLACSSAWVANACSSRVRSRCAWA